MTQRVLIASLVLLAATVLSIVTIDGPIAVAATHVAPTLKQFALSFTNVLEIVFLFSISKFASGALVLVVAAALAPVRRLRAVSWTLAFAGSAQLLTRLVAGVLKNAFLRSRPFEALADGSWSDQFFATAGSSFPSGHAAHFWGFFFALALVMPRRRWWLLPITLLLSIARVLVNDHYVSDILASATLAAAITSALAPFFVHRVLSARRSSA